MYLHRERSLLRLPPAAAAETFAAKPRLEKKRRKTVIYIQNSTTTATTRTRTSPFQDRDHLQRPHRGCVRHRERGGGGVPLCHHRGQPSSRADAGGTERGGGRVQADLGGNKRKKRSESNGCQVLRKKRQRNFAQ